MIARLRPETGYADIFLSFFGFTDHSEALEKGLLDFFGVKKIIFTQSARAGLYFLFKALPQKKVFTPSYTCWVVVEAARLAGKEIEFIDIKLSDYNMDVELLCKKIKPDSIILATHQFGIPCDVDEILKIAEDNRCYVIEDNAAAFGSEYKGKRTGSLAGASVISFEFTKTLTCGRGGAILFNDEKLYAKTKEIFDAEVRSGSFFFTAQYFVFLFFTKFLTQKIFYGLTHALFIRAKGLTTAVPDYSKELNALYVNRLSRGFKNLIYRNFRRVQNTLSVRKNIAKFYSESLSGARKVERPQYLDTKSPVFMRYPVRVKGVQKEDFYTSMSKQGIDLAFTFPYSCDMDKSNSPNSYVAAESVLNLPIYSYLNERDLLKITQSLTPYNKA